MEETERKNQDRKIRAKKKMVKRKERKEITKKPDGRKFVFLPQRQMEKCSLGMDEWKEIQVKTDRRRISRRETERKETGNR